MSSETLHLNTRSQSYDPPPEKKTDDFPSDKPSVSTPPLSDGLQIEKPILDAILHPPKSTLQKYILNPNARAAQYYNIIEYMAQASYVMSALKVLKTCPTQRKNFLIALRDFDPENNKITTFKLDDFNTRLSHQLDFQLSTKSIGNTIHRTTLEEGTSTSVMSLSCWRAIGSPEVNRSPTTLKAFDGRGFKPYGLLPSLQIELGGKSVSIHVEIVDAPLDYNIFLGCN